MEKVSIIIPCAKIQEITRKCVKECLNLDYPDFEVILLPDEKTKESFNDKKVKIIETGKIKPAPKRNIGMKKAKGKYFAFIDDDAYPRKDWLKNSVKYLEKNKKIGIVGGPNLTPKEANFAEKISGYVQANYFVSGPASIRFKIASNQYTRELPSCNYISRREISPEYFENLLTAEDSKFCFDVKKKGYKIYYAKDVVVYHHRRETLKKHLKQLYSYGRDIAWLTKKEFSFDKLFFSIMSLFVISFLILLVASVFSYVTRVVFSISFSIYLLLMFLTSIHENIRVTIYVFVISIATHFSYGLGWLYGIFKPIEKTNKAVWNTR